MDYQWYPGHMTKARRQMQEDMKLVDLVIELADARLPLSSRNPDIDTLAGSKSRILVLNKADLADEQVSRLWKEAYSGQGLPVALVNALDRTDMKQIRPLMEQAHAQKALRDRARGIINRPVRAMICGIPNVGKSTFINTLAGRSSARTGNKPGVTRGKQWISIGKNVQLLDTPGILWPRFDDPFVGRALAAAGSIRDEVLDSTDLALWLISFLQGRYPQAVAKAYSLDCVSDDPLRQIAFARGCLKSGKEPDTDRAASIVLDDFRKGKLGKISLEIPSSTV